MGIVQNPEITLEELQSFNINERIAALLNLNIQQQQEWACESLIDMMLSQFSKFILQLQGQGLDVMEPDKLFAFTSLNLNQSFQNAKMFDAVLDTISNVYLLLKSNDYNIINKSCSYIIYAMFFYGPAKKQQLFKPENQLTLMNAIKNNRQISELKNLTKVWAWGLQLSDSRQQMVSEDQRALFNEVVDKLKKLDDKIVTATLRDVLKLLY